MPGRPRQVALVLAAAVVAAGVVASCGSMRPSQPAAASSPIVVPTAAPGETAEPTLLVLATVDDVRVLGFVRPSVGVVALPLPDPSTMAVTPMGDGSLVALLADGRAFVAPEGPAGLLSGTEWHPLELEWNGALPTEAIVFAASASPDGKRIAAVARPPFAESPSALVIVEPAAGRAAASVLPDESTGAPPAWLEGDHVAVVQRGRAGQTFLAVLIAASGKVVDRITFRALDIGTSGDAGTTVIHGDESRLLVGPTTDVLERRRAPDGGPDLAPGDVVRGGVALDRDGRRLAAVVEDTAGISRIATFVRAGDGWEPDVRFAAPPGSFGGRLAWLP
jgi:hypothetical protein